MYRLKILMAGVIGLAVVVAIASLMPGSASRVKAVVPYGTGDVFAGVGGGIVNHYSNQGTLLEALNTTTGSSEDTGMCFDASGNLYTTNFEANNTSKFDDAGNLLLASWGGPYNMHPESCVRDASGHIYVGEADGSHLISKFDTAGTLLATYAPTALDRGLDWIDLAADQCTILYASEGSAVHSFNVCTNSPLGQQQPDFATGLSGPCFAVRIRANGEVMVACQSQVYRLDASGATIQTYTTGSVSPVDSFFFAMNLDPDGLSFWTAGVITGNIYRINIATGAQLMYFNAPHSPSLAGLAIFGEQTAGGGGDITICKRTNPVGGTGFNFGWGFPTDRTVPFTLSDGGCWSSSLPPSLGPYSFQELQPTPGWTLVNIVCTGGANMLIGSNAVFDPGDTGVGIDLGSGEHVTCTFFNTSAAVGGTTDLEIGGAQTAGHLASQSGSSSMVPDALLPLGLAGVAVLGIGGWYVRRRFAAKAG